MVRVIGMAWLIFATGLALGILLTLAANRQPPSGPPAIPVGDEGGRFTGSRRPGLNAWPRKLSPRELAQIAAVLEVA